MRGRGINIPFCRARDRHWDTPCLYLREKKSRRLQQIRLAEGHFQKLCVLTQQAFPLFHLTAASEILAAVDNGRYFFPEIEVRDLEINCDTAGIYRRDP
jgi:hypothetical protein